MADIIYNTSQVIDNSTEPPIVVTSNQVQTLIRTPIRPIPTPHCCYQIFICPEECCCRRHNSKSCQQNFPEMWIDNENCCCHQNRNYRNSDFCCERNDRCNHSSHRGKSCFDNLFRFFC